MRRTTVGLIAAATTLVGFTVATPALAKGDSASLEELVPALAAPQRAADIVPEAVRLHELNADIDEASSRFLGRDVAADYWIARSGTSQLCFISYVRAEEFSGSTCADITVFHKHGIGLSTGTGGGTPESSAEAYLLPADITLPGRAYEERSSVMRMGQVASPSGFVTVDPSSPGLEPFDVSRADGSEFRFAPARDGRG